MNRLILFYLYRSRRGLDNRSWPVPLVPKKCYSGFTVLELLISVSVIGILAAIAIPNVIKYKNNAQIGAAKVEIRLTQKKIDFYFMDTQIYPDSLGDIGLSSRNDPWGNPYQYLKIAGVDFPVDDSENGNSDTITTIMGRGKKDKDKEKGWRDLIKIIRGRIKSKKGDKDKEEEIKDGETAERRKDNSMIPVNSDYDLYSPGTDGRSEASFTAAPSRDDVVRAKDGAYIGLASQY